MRIFLKNIPCKLLTLIAAAGFAVLLPVAAQAQQEQPSLPAPLQNLVDEGAQIRYLGSAHGLDGWITIKNGQEQYFYVLPDGEAFVMGLLFDKEGKMVTMRQVHALQQKNSGETLDMFARNMPPSGGTGNEAAPFSEEAAENTLFKTPAEQLFEAVERSNWIPLGKPEAPAIYTFIDPQCSHCHSFLQDLRSDYIANGLIQVRIVPVGFKEDTRAQAAFLLAAPNPQERLFNHIDGDSAALPVMPNINQQGIQRNLAIMQGWKLNVTPLTVYRNAKGEIKIIQGRASNISQVLSDLTG